MPDLLGAFGIPRAILPRIRSSSEVYGDGTLEAVRGVPVAGILGDQQAALVGQTCFAAGEAKNTYGTGCFLLMNTGTEIVQSRFGLLTTVAYQIKGQPAHYALEGSVAITGALVQWIRDNFGLIATKSRNRSAGAHGGGQRRRLFRPGFLRTVRALLEAQRARRDRRADPLHQQGPPGPRGAGGHGLPDARSGGGHGEGRRRPRQRAADRRRHGGERAADAVPGRHPGPHGRAAGGEGDHRARRRLCGRPGGRASTGASKSCARSGRWIAPGSRDMDAGASATACTASGRRQSRGRSTGWRNNR